MAVVFPRVLGVSGNFNTVALSTNSGELVNHLSFENNDPVYNPNVIPKWQKQLRKSYDYYAQHPKTVKGVPMVFQGISAANNGFIVYFTDVNGQNPYFEVKFHSSGKTITGEWQISTI